ncbi:hypothetical protein ACFC08_02480 [Streptomyces sp. NPDC056112]|uniref:hypothetical protein n=1 Tax=unclassified Streptomyces TaxID=2593676 RepID=UPI0027E1A3F8|nr:hypothetical protein [Streptomyces sp. CoT10]
MDKNADDGADGHRGGGVPAGHVGFTGERDLPVLSAPDAGAGGIDGDHADGGFRAHATAVTAVRRAPGRRPGGRQAARSRPGDHGHSAQ